MPLRCCPTTILQTISTTSASASAAGQAAAARFLRCASRQMAAAAIRSAVTIGPAGLISTSVHARIRGWPLPPASGCRFRYRERVQPVEVGDVDERGQHHERRGVPQRSPIQS